MTEKLHILTGKIDGSSYLVLSSEGSHNVTSLKYLQPDRFIIEMRKKRRTCRVPTQVFVSSPWTNWLKEKSQNS